MSHVTQAVGVFICCSKVCVSGIKVSKAQNGEGWTQKWVFYHYEASSQNEDE